MKNKRIKSFKNRSKRKLKFKRIKSKSKSNRFGTNFSEYIFSKLKGSKGSKQTTLVILEPQIDNVIGSGNENGSKNAMINLISFIKSYGNTIDSIMVLLRINDKLNIESKNFWISSKGKTPELGTTITLDDIPQEWTTIGYPGFKTIFREFHDKAIEYIKNHGSIVITPEYCVDATPGASIYEPLYQTITNWERNKGVLSDAKYKSTRLMVSYFPNDVEIPSHFVNSVLSYNNVLISNFSAKPKIVDKFINDTLNDESNNGHNFQYLACCSISNFNENLALNQCAKKYKNFRIVDDYTKVNLIPKTSSTMATPDTKIDKGLIEARAKAYRLPEFDANYGYILYSQDLFPINPYIPNPQDHYKDVSHMKKLKYWGPNFKVNAIFMRTNMFTVNKNNQDNKYMFKEYLVIDDSTKLLFPGRYFDLNTLKFDLKYETEQVLKQLYSDIFTDSLKSVVLKDIKPIYSGSIKDESTDSINAWTESTFYVVNLNLNYAENVETTILSTNMINNNVMDNIRFCNIEDLDKKLCPSQRIVLNYL